MSLNLQNIITEADILVPNSVSTADKVQQLNIINREFFNVVKVPKVERFTTTLQADYTLPEDVRDKNIDLVQVGPLRYLNISSGMVGPLQNSFSYDDVSGTLSLDPAPYRDGLMCTVRYRRVATTTFSSGELTATPDAPDEYHGTYITALAAWLAAVMMLNELAVRYEAQYQAEWQAASREFNGGAVDGR